MSKREDKEELCENGCELRENNPALRENNRALREDILELREDAPELGEDIHKNLKFPSFCKKYPQVWIISKGFENDNSTKIILVNERGITACESFNYFSSWYFLLGL